MVADIYANKLGIDMLDLIVLVPILIIIIWRLKLIEVCFRILIFGKFRLGLEF